MCGRLLVIIMVKHSEHPLMFIQSFYLGGAWHNPVIIGLPEGESVFKVTDRAKLAAAQFPLKML